MQKLLLGLCGIGALALAAGCSGGGHAVDRGIQTDDGGALAAGGAGGAGMSGAAGSGQPDGSSNVGRDAAAGGGADTGPAATGGVVGTGGAAGMPGTGGAGTGGLAGAVGSGGAGPGGAAGMAATGGAAGGSGGGSGCPDLFDQTLQAFSIEISPDNWAAIQSEFMSAGQLPDDMFVQYNPAYYPIVFHYGAETVTDAYIRLKGDSSWREAVAYDGANGKMQFVIAFDQVDSKADFHGLSKIVFDMPRTDLTFMHDRISNMWLRSIGVPAVCATNAVLTVNGSPYGLFVLEEKINHHFIKQWFPGNSSGDLFKGGWTPETNESNPDWTRLDQFWAVTTVDQLTAIVDLPPSLLSWAAEAMLNDADGYYGGDHNFFIYDEGAGKGYVFFPDDLDSTLDYAGQFTSDPIAWWSSQHNVTDVPEHYRIVMGDPNLRAQYIAALATQLGKWNVPQIQSWIDTAAGQIAAAVQADPHKPASTTMDVFQSAVALAREGIQARADYVASWLACRASGTGPDQDGDGVIWCMDCRDDDATIHPGAAEICGNGIDENCNGLFDEGCR